MKKAIKNKVVRAIAKQFEVKSSNVILLESTGNIEDFVEFQDTGLFVARETFGFAIYINEYIDLGFVAEVKATKLPQYSNEVTYEVEEYTIEEAPQYKWNGGEE